MVFNESEFIDQIFNANILKFDELAIQLFLFQYKNNELYRNYCNSLGIKIPVNNISTIPFLPVDFFKTNTIKCGNFSEKIIFESSGTTNSVSSKHFIKDISVYQKSFTTTFNCFYGDVRDYCILALLPNYLERGNSSLVFMVDKLIKNSNHPESGFYLNDFKKLCSVLKTVKEKNRKNLLIGVTYALLDFAENFSPEIPELIVMETGGMKGRRKEMIREEVHHILQKSFFVKNIHSEYGMTELLSQAYSKEDGNFFCPPWMKIIITDTQDPIKIIEDGKTGVINIIDLANIYSCAFIKTDDLGFKNADGSFEITGRLDNSDLRGCNLMCF